MSPQSHLSPCSLRLQSHASPTKLSISHHTRQHTWWHCHHACLSPQTQRQSVPLQVQPYDCQLCASTAVTWRVICKNCMGPHFSRTEWRSLASLACVSGPLGASGSKSCQLTPEVYRCATMCASLHKYSGIGVGGFFSNSYTLLPCES